MSLLTHNSTPAERARGCTFAETFESAQAVAQNGATISGTPDIDFGAVLDGAGDYMVYPANYVFGRAYCSIVLEFTPTFAANEDVTCVLMDASDGGRYGFTHNGAAGTYQLAVRLGDTGVEFLAEATYGPYWLKNQRNVLVLSGTTGNTNIWLNGTQILSSDVTAWTPDSPANLYIGAQYTGGLTFPGTFHSVKIFNQALTAQEALDYYNDTTYTYENECSLHLPMGAAQHDPTNLRTLDVSGNARHATFGDGSTPTTYPTKIARHHGYNYDGGDYLVVPGTGVFNAAGVTIAIEFTPDFAYDDGVSHILLDTTGAARYLVYKGAANNLQIFLNTVSVLNAATAAFSPYWRQGSYNLLVASSITGVNAMWLNGQIVNVSTTAWTPGNPADMWIAGAWSRYTGDMQSFRVWRKALTPLQIHDLTIRTLGKVNDVGA